MGVAKERSKNHIRARPRILHKMAVVVGKQMGWQYVGRDCAEIKERRVAGCSLLSSLRGHPTPM